MDDNQLLRYSRHILLPQIAYEGQQQLTQSHALIIGAGGLGSPAAMYLAAAGVGQLTICDFDTVDLTNLQRQIIHQTQSIGLNKAISAQKTLQALNPEVNICPFTQKANPSQLAELISDADIVLDCSDNFQTRYQVNSLCYQNNTPLVSGAAVGFDGQITVFDFRQADSPCYACLFPDDGSEDSMRCADNGVFSPLVGIIGATQAAEAIKALLGIGQTLTGRLLLLDAISMEWRSIKFTKDDQCKLCNRS
jgi:molybdopterin/thiamine biosynthesis adenylyltransferase